MPISGVLGAATGAVYYRQQSLAESRNAWDPAYVDQLRQSLEFGMLSGMPTPWEEMRLGAAYTDWDSGHRVPEAQTFHPAAPLLLGGALGALWSALRRPQPPVGAPITQAMHSEAEELARGFQRPVVGGVDFTTPVTDHALLSMNSAHTAVPTGTATLTPQFGVQNIPVMTWARDHGLALVTDLSEQQLLGTKQIIMQALGGNLSREVVAPLIEQTINLHPRQSQWVADRLAKDLANGVPQAQALLNSRAFSERLLRQRALVIARTEIMAAENQGQLEAWRQAVRDGTIPKQARKVWVKGPGACDICTTVNGTAVKIEDEFPGVGVLVPPAHPNCRCTVGLAADLGRVKDISGLDLRTHRPVPVTKHKTGHDERTHGNRGSSAGGGAGTRYSGGAEKTIPASIDGNTLSYGDMEWEANGVVDHNGENPTLDAQGWDAVYQDWAYYEGNHAMRLASAALMGEPRPAATAGNDSDVSSIMHDGDTYGVGDAAIRAAKGYVEGAVVGLRAVAASPPVGYELYRGLSEVDADAPIRSVRAGDTLTMPLTAFSTDGSAAMSFTTDVGANGYGGESSSRGMMVVLEEGARGAPGGSEGSYDEVTGQPVPWEFVTEGRYKVVGTSPARPYNPVTHESSVYEVTIRQTAFFDLDRGWLNMDGTIAKADLGIPDWVWAMGGSLAPGYIAKHQAGSHDQKSHGRRSGAAGGRSEDDRVAAATTRIQAALPNADLSDQSQVSMTRKETLEQMESGQSVSYNAYLEAGFPKMEWDAAAHGVKLKPTADEMEAIADAAEKLRKEAPLAADDCKRINFDSLVSDSGLNRNLAQADWAEGGWRVTFDLERSRFAFSETNGSPRSSLFRQASNPAQAQHVTALHEFAHGVAMSGEMSHQVMGRAGDALTRKLLFNPSPAGLASAPSNVRPPASGQPWAHSANAAVSDYAMTNPGEFFAENVASLWSGIGKPHGDTQHWLSEYMLWRSRAVQKAITSPDEVPEEGGIEDDFGEEPWLGWETEISKHQGGGHDQKTHGRRAGGSGGGGPKPQQMKTEQVGFDQALKAMPGAKAVSKAYKAELVRLADECGLSEMQEVSAALREAQLRKHPQGGYYLEATDRKQIGAVAGQEAGYYMKHLLDRGAIQTERDAFRFREVEATIGPEMTERLKAWAAEQGPDTRLGRLTPAMRGSLMGQLSSLVAVRKPLRDLTDEDRAYDLSTLTQDGVAAPMKRWMEQDAVADIRRMAETNPDLRDAINELATSPESIQRTVLEAAQNFAPNHRDTISAGPWDEDSKGVALSLHDRATGLREQILSKDKLAALTDIDRDPGSLLKPERAKSYKDGYALALFPEDFRDPTFLPEGCAYYPGTGTIRVTLSRKQIDAVSAGGEFPQVWQDLGVKRSALEGQALSQWTKNVVDRWAGHSSDSDERAVALQLAVAQRFGLDESTMTSGVRDLLNDPAVVDSARGVYENEGPLFDAFVESTYQRTQSWLADNGLDTVGLYRGFRVPQTRTGTGWPKDGSHGTTRYFTNEQRKAPTEVEASSNPISSWASQPTIAAQFARSGEDAVVFSARYPAAAVWSTPFTGPGCLNEWEFLPLGRLGRMTMWPRVHSTTTPASTTDLDAAIARLEDPKYNYASGMVKAEQQPVLHLDADPVNADWIKWRTDDVDSDGNKIVPTYRALLTAATGVVTKHKTGHDEKAHGNRAGGGGLTRVARKIVESAEAPDQLRALWDDADPLDATATAFDLDTIKQRDLDSARSEIHRRSQEALERDGFPEEFTVWRQGDIGRDRQGVVTGLQSVSTKKLSSQHYAFPDQRPYTLRRDDVQVYSNALFPRSFVGEEELLVTSASLIVKHQLGTHDQMTHGHRGNAKGSHGPKDIGPDGRDMNHLRELSDRIAKVISPEGMVILDGLDADVAEQTTWAVEEFAKKYPDAAKKIGAIMTTVGGDTMALREDAVATTYVQNAINPRTGQFGPMIRVSLNAPYMNDTRTLKFQELTGDTVRGSAYGVTIHEMGHVLNHTRALTQNPDIRDEEYAHYDYAGDHIPDRPLENVSLSGYATYNTSECVAEAFTADWFGNRSVPRLSEWQGQGDMNAQPAWLQRILANLKADMS